MNVFQSNILQNKIKEFGGIEKILLEYNSGKSLKNINSISDIGCKTLSKLIKENGYELRNDSEKTRKYYLNQNSFDVLNEESVYWIGFIMGDGSIGKTGKEFAVLTIALNSKDVSHLEKFKKFINTDKPLHFQKNHNTYSITINSKYICDRLYSFGIINRKSYNATEKKNIPENLEKHYWRGLIDADGHLRYDKKYDKWYIGLTGSYTLCSQFFEYITKKLCFKSKIVVRQVSENGYRVEFGGKKLPLKIIECLYCDSNIYLDRKFSTYLESKKYISENEVILNA